MYVCELKTKRQLTVWSFQDEPHQTKFVRARNTSKQMVIVFLYYMGLQYISKKHKTVLYKSVEPKVFYPLIQTKGETKK